VSSVFLTSDPSLKEGHGGGGRGKVEEGKIIQSFVSAVHVGFCRERITWCLAVVLWLFALIQCRGTA